MQGNSFSYLPYFEYFYVRIIHMFNVNFVGQGCLQYYFNITTVLFIKVYCNTWNVEWNMEWNKMVLFNL